MADPNTRQGKRTPVTLKIKFKSETLEQFIERYAVDVSQGGIFIRTKEPLAVLLRESLALQFTVVVPVEKVDPDAGVQTTATEPSTRSIAVAVKVTVLFCVVMFAGSESTGAVVSTTMILNVPFEHCTVVVPMGKIEPDAGAQLPRGRPFSSS